MMMSYETPEAFKMALEQRLRNAASNSGLPIDRERQLLVFDRFLARLFTLYSDVIVLKGGMALELRLERARMTRDIDIGIDSDSGETLGKLQRAGRLQMDDFLRYEITEDKEHPEIVTNGMKYQGYRFRARAMLAGKLYGNPFGVDIAVGEPTHGSLDKICGSNFLSFSGIEPVYYRLLSLETHIAEKLHAYTMPRLHSNSRVKDFPDLALLASLKAYDSEELGKAIRLTFEHRGTHAVPDVLPDPPPTWEPLYLRIKTNDDLPWDSLRKLTEAIQNFLDTVLLKETGRWNPEQWCWEKRNKSSR